MSHLVYCGLRARFTTTLLTTLFAWMALTGAASAQTFTLSGVVTGGGTPINGATVEALTNGTTTVAGTSTTNAQGQYSIVLGPAIYDLRVTPPGASGYGPEVLQDIDLTASNQQVDVVLLSSTGSLSGTVRGVNGAPVPGANVSLYTQNGAQFLVNTTTDTNGFYSAPTNASIVYVVVNRSGPFSAAPASSWQVNTNNVPAGPGAIFNLDLPVATVSGTVTDTGGNPVGNATITTSGSANTPNNGFLSANSSATANAAGAYSVIVFKTSTDFTVRPPAGSQLGALTERITIVGDLAHNFALPAGASLTGIVRGYGNQGVGSVTVTARSPLTGSTLASTSTAADGSYTLNLPNGTVNLMFNRSGPVGVAPNSSWSVTRNGVAIAGATTFNLDLPVVAITGTTTTAAAVPIAGATITADSFGSDSQGTWSSNATATTDAGGAHSFLLFRGTANFLIRPPGPAAGTSAPLVDRGVALTADLVRNFVAPDAITVGGIVRGVGGQPIAGANVTAVHTSGVSMVSTTTDLNGSYSMGLPSGTLSYIQFNRGTLSAAAPTNWTYRRFNFPVAGPTTFDVALNVIRLNGTATDSNGAPVSNVNVAPNTSRSQTGGDLTEWFSNGSVHTTAAGSYTMLLLTGTGSVTIRPPTNSGFSQATLNPVTFANNFTQRIVLQRPDTTAPVIVSGPAVLHLSDSSVSIGWTTNEPSTSIVDFGIGGFTQQLASPALVTQHSVTLQGLTPHEIYSFRVSSRDASNNGPVQSAPDFFTMLAPPGDVTPPSILAGPAAVFLSDTSAIVQWLTNEPASGLVRYGTTPAFGNQVASGAGEFVGLHATLLPGLTPSTDYFAQVESTDPDGNTILSSTFTFRTAAAPDIQAPVITSGPTVTRTHNAATIRWTTDEAATSGVSYNDGVAFYLTNSESLHTTHEVILTGLTPSRTYFFTLSSRDAAGNGPTLAGPTSFTTLATPDVTPPVISNVTVVPTKNSALVSWDTSEVANGTARFGTVSGTLNQIVSNLSFTPSHQLTLGGLTPGTTYYYTVGSTDPSGNPATSAEASFVTLPEDVNVPPTPPSPVTVSPNPSNTGSFTIVWGASSDDGPGGVQHYQVLLGETVVETLPPTATNYLASGVAAGSHTYRIRATDFSDASTLSDPVTVIVDLTPPQLNLPADISTPATTNTDAIVTYTVTATDNSDPNPVVTCSPVSGSAFPIGTTPVPCTARDAAGNVTPGSFNVTVTDPFPPILTVPADISVQAQDQNGAPVIFTVTATDNHDPGPLVSCSPASGSLFPIAVTPVICTATDASGNVATRSFNVSVGAPPKVASSTAVESSVATPTFGQEIVLTATVNGTGGSTPTGNVQFMDGTTLVGQAALGAPAGGPGSPVTAALTISTLPAGTRSITASYVGDLGHEASTSAALVLEITKAVPTVVVTGGTFAYDAMPHPGAGSVTGVGGTSIGALTFTYNGGPDAPVVPGIYAVVGSFAGSDDYEPGSANATITITPGGTQTAVQPASPIVFGQSATVGATVTSPTGEVPTGSVEFFNGVTPVGVAALNGAGTAAVVVPGLAVGTHTFTAVYSGGGNFAASVSAGAGLEVMRAATATSLTITPNPSGFLEAFRLVATVAVTPPGTGIPAGVVEFFSGSTPIGIANLNLVSGVPTAVIPMNGFPEGTYQITARYAGATSFAPSTSDVVSQNVRGLESSTWTVLTVSPTPSSRVGTSVTLRAVVVPLGGTVLPTGLVQFYAWGSPVGTPVALANVGGAMTATLTTAAMPSGLMQLRAHYLGNGSFSPSVSTPVSHTVYASTAPFATTTTMTLSGNPIAFGDSLTVTVSVASGPRPTPGYFLLAMDGVPTQALAVVSGSPASFVVPNLGRGLHGVTVQFIPTTTTLAGSLAHMFVFVQ